MFDVFYSGKKPGVFAHERKADSVEHAQQLSRTRYFWWITYLADYSDFDFLWEPVPWQSEFTHSWPSQHHEYSGTYLVPRAGEIKYHFHSQIVPTRHIPADFDVLTNAVDFDYSWAPHPHDPPYIYVFGNQWWPAEKMPTVEYTVPDATQRKYMHKPQAQLQQQHNNRWHTLIDCEWDYSWVPDPGDPPMIYVFGNQWWSAEKMPTIEYHVPGATQRKYMSWPRARLLPDHSLWTVPDTVDSNTVDTSWVPDPGSPAYIYQFGTQWQKTGGAVYTMSGATEVKYISAPRSTKVTVDPYWEIPDGVDTESFDWTWHPDTTDQPYIYQFGTQHQRTGGPRYCVPGATEVKYVEQVSITTTADTAVIVEIDHMDGNAGQISGTAKRVRYFDNYRDTLLRIAKSLLGEHEFAWVCSSICDYEGFDFSWHPEQWQATMLHVFPSNEQKFGDTFYMHVPTFVERIEKKALLEWYDVNYVDKMVIRRRLPVIEHNQDSQADAVKDADWAGPLALFTTTGLPMTIPTVPLWRKEVKTVVPLSVGASAVIVPKVAKGDVKTQLYDYPYIDKTQRKRHYDELLDIVFISNGEPNAKSNYLQMTMYLANELRYTNRVHVVEGVNGRVAAYHAAARASTTPWFFAVFAKLEVTQMFDWTWQPDRMQQAKHYIFHASNPVNGLVYGHQAMIAYNRQLALENTGVGLDFTLDQAHEVIPIVSGTANYAETPWMAWRTAFREVIKLQDSLPDVENEYRLEQWLTKDNTDGQWSMKGAQDALEFYKSVNGNSTELRKSYDWAWLATYAFMKRSLTTDQ
jgi:hypothetical protein